MLSCAVGGGIQHHTESVVGHQKPLPGAPTFNAFGFGNFYNLIVGRRRLFAVTSHVAFGNAPDAFNAR